MTGVQIMLTAIGLVVMASVAAVAGRLARPTRFHRRAVQVVLVFAAVASIAAALFPARTTAESAADVASLESADHFLRGLVGFAGHRAPADLAFDRLLASPDAQARFVQLALSPAATPAAKAYAICGLKTLNSARLPETIALVRGDGGHVSTLHGDVMSKRPLAQAIEAIVRTGC